MFKEGLTTGAHETKRSFLFIISVKFITNNESKGSFTKTGLEQTKNEARIKTKKLNVRVCSPVDGLYQPVVPLWTEVSPGDLIGTVVDLLGAYANTHFPLRVCPEPVLANRRCHHNWLCYSD